MVKNGKKIGLALVAVVLTLCVGILPAFAQPEYYNPDALPFYEDSQDDPSSLFNGEIFESRLNSTSIQSYADALQESLKWYSSFGYQFQSENWSSSGISYEYYNVTEWTPLVIYEFDLGLLSAMQPEFGEMSGYVYSAIVTAGTVTARNWTDTSFAGTEIAPGYYITMLNWNEQTIIMDYGGFELENGGSFVGTRPDWPGENKNMKGTNAFGRVVYNFNSTFGEVGLVQENIDPNGVNGYVGLYDRWHNASLAFDGQLTGGGGASEEELESAYNDGYSAGYTAGDSNGYGRGYDDGYEDGEEYGFRTGYSQGHDEGYDQGYDQGYKDINQGAYDEGYGAGFGAGQGVGYSTGYTAGYTAGEEVGYNNGYRAGYSETPVDLDVDSAVNSFFSGLHSIFDGWFGVEIFGISVAGTLIGILIVCIVAFVVKKLV